MKVKILFFLLPFFVGACSAGLSSHQSESMKDSNQDNGTESHVSDDLLSDDSEHITGPDISFGFIYNDYSSFYKAYGIYKKKNKSFPLFLFDFDGFSSFLPEYRLIAIGNSKYSKLKIPDCRLVSCCFAFRLESKGTIDCRYQSIGLEYKVDYPFEPLDTFDNSKVGINFDDNNTIGVMYSGVKILDVTLSLNEGYSETLKENLLNQLKDSLVYLD